MPIGMMATPIFHYWFVKSVICFGFVAIKKKEWQKVTEKIKCLRCGKCCFYPQEGAWNFKNSPWLPCRFLTVGINGVATCTRYHKRLGSDMGPGAVCGRREDLPYNIPGCPFNTPDKEPHPFFKDG